MQFTSSLIYAVGTLLLATIVAARNIEETSLQHRVKRQDKYATQYDDSALLRVFNSPGMVLSYLNCILDKGPCTREGREMKKNLPAALATDCANCSEAQKTYFGPIVTFIILSYPNEWNQLVAKFDSNGELRKKYGYAEEDDEEDE